MSRSEEAKGRIKEAAGDLLGNEHLEREGEAQSEKEQAQQEAHEAQSEARRHDVAAREEEARERAAQELK